MGSFAHFWLGNLNIDSSKNDIDIDLISLFRKQDKNILTPPFNELPYQLESYKENGDEENEFRIVYYSAPIKVIYDRLNVFGYNLTTTKEAFKFCIDYKCDYINKMSRIFHTTDTPVQTQMENHYRDQIEILSIMTPEAWVENIKQIQKSNLKFLNFRNNEAAHSIEDPLLRYMLSNDLFGFPGNDIFIPLRLALEVFDDQTIVVYDLTELVNSGYFEYDEDFIEYGVRIFANEYNGKSKTLVLTEGKTDAWILEKSLGILYPHLKEYYSFLDFENTGFGGGVGNLVNVVKAFAGAGIINNVIAVFDNDTASVSALKVFENITLPPNIEILRLPEIDLLNNYPTLGPTGLVEMNINGIAASIELFLGEDILRTNGTDLAPIQWMGFDRLVKNYQGEVLEKDLLHERFKEKINHPEKSEDCSWNDLQVVFNKIFSAFQDRNKKRILKPFL